MKLVRFLIAVVLFQSVITKSMGQTFEDSLGLQTSYISLQETIHRVIENSLDVKIEWVNWEVADEQAKGALGKFNPSYYLNGNYTDSRLPLNALEYAQIGGLLIPLTDPNLFRQQNTILESGFSGLLPTGTSYSIFTNTGRFRNDVNRQQPPSVYSPEYSTAVGVSLVQPLLKDFGPGVQLAEVRVMRRNRAIADYRWEMQLHKAVADAVVEYNDLMLVVENISLKRDVVAFARSLVADVNQRISQGSQGEEINLREAELSVSMAQEDLVRALSLAAERQVNLKNQIFGSSEEETGVILLAKDPLRKLPVRMNRQDLLRTALQRRPDHLAALEEVERRGILTKYMKNQSLPRLDLQATLTTNGLSGNYGSAYDRASDRQGYEAQVGFRFSYPLGNQTARANRATASNLERQAILALEKTELNMAVEISTLIARVKAAGAKLNAIQRTVGLSDGLVEMARKSNSEGGVTNQGLIRSRIQMTEGQMRKMEALVDYNRAAVQLSLASGTLLEDYGITIDRGSVRPQAVKTASRGR